MTLRLGIDTGGTYTDAVVMDEACTRVVAKAKVPTTHDALVVGIGSVLDAVVSQPGVFPEAIGLVSLSTTLATNALVEGQGDPASLVLAGFGEGEIERLRTDAGDDPIVVVTGGHDALGNQLAPLDPDELVVAATVGGARISAHAVACQFSVRNPSHELAVAEVLTATTGLPVTCSHELSSRLDGPRRAMTALLNARLIGMIARLGTAVDAALTAAGISAPLMVVRGDGSLVSADFVARRPIETILSGPAASVIGARHLAGAGPSGGPSGFGATAALGAPLDGLVVDIGGTTTDIAAVTDGRPTIAPDGAEVAGHRTMVDAIDLVTHGLGGDSEVRFGDDGELVLGPARAVPLSRIAVEVPELLEGLARQLDSAPGHGQGRFLVRTGREAALVDLDDVERSMLAALAAGPIEEGELAPTNRALRRVDRLRRLGLVRVATLTPTDAAILLGSYDPSPPTAAETPPSPLGRAEAVTPPRPLGPVEADGGGPERPARPSVGVEGAGLGMEAARPSVGVEGAGVGMEAARPSVGVEGAGVGMEAARLGAGLLARRRDHRGRAVASSPEELAERIVDVLIARSADRVLSAALRADGLDGLAGGDDSPAESLLRAGLAHHRGLVSLTAGLGAPIVAVGASAATYYGPVAASLGTEVIVPSNAEVANAVGAAVGLIRIEQQVTITRPRAGRYVIHGLVAKTGEGEPVAFASIEDARAVGEERLGPVVVEGAQRAGASPDTIDVEVSWSARTATIEGRELFVEGTLTAIATGRPRMAPGRPRGRSTTAPLPAARRGAPPHDELRDG